MKKKIAVNLLKPGAVFSEPVFIEGESIFVPAGVPVLQKDIDKLNAWGVTEVETEGEAVDTGGGAPAADDGAAQNGAKKPSVLALTEVQERKVSYRNYMFSIEQLDNIFINIGTGMAVEAHAIDEICSQILQGIREQRESFIGFILGGEVSGFEMAKSSVNTAILSALISQELRFPRHRVMQVVTGALLHDVGMLRLPTEILNKRGGLSELEHRKIKSHPVLAYRIVTGDLGYPEEVSRIVLEHHERWDGDGYPRRIKGAGIDPGARIVSVADAFEAMVSQKPYRNSMVGYQAMKNLLADNSRRFDPEVLKAFITAMGIYPIGSIVQLNNKVIGRVVEARSNAPLRPKIQVLIDENGKMFRNEEGNIIDLLGGKNIYITKAVDSKELPEQP